MNESKIKGHLSMIGANVMWGLMSPIVKLVLASGTLLPFALIDFRIAGAALLFWITSIFTPREHVPLKDILLLLGAGMLGVLFNQGCFIIGVSLTSPGEASLVTTTMPMWVMLLAWIILREPITPKKAFGILCGAIGAIILILVNTSAFGASRSSMIGDLIVLLAQLSYAFYLTLYRNFIRKYSLVTLMKWMFLSATIVALPSTAIKLVEIDWQAVTSTEWAGIGFIVFCGTYLAYIGIMTGQKSLRPTVVGMYNYVQPIVATCVGIAIGMDKFTIPKIIAVALIFTGVYMVSISRAKQPMHQ